MLRLTALVMSYFLVGCGARVAVAPKPPSTAAETQAGSVESAKPRAQASVLPKLDAVPEPSSVCQKFSAQTQYASDACARSDAAPEALASALEITDVIERDARLFCLESQPGLARGLVRALRAELAPTECGDVLTVPLLDQRPKDIEPRLKDTLLALALAGRLTRLVHEPPKLAPPFTKPAFLEFLKTTLTPWVLAQARAIQELSMIGAGLSSYAKGVVAVEAGLADMRFVGVVRDVPLPEELRNDPEIRDVYYMALEEALEPRKTRGRDATLVGLRILAKEGILFDARIERARSLLSELYSGRRIDALDRLLLPTLAAPQSTSVELRLAKSLPTFYAGMLLRPVSIDASLLRALLDRGIPPAFEASLLVQTPAPEIRDLYARALFTRGQRYFRADDFAQAERIARSGTANDTSALLAALASPLKSGPKDAVEVLLRGPTLPTSLAQVAELDQLAASRNAFAALAAFDAAFLLSLVPPQDDPKFWDDIARRFKKVAPGLSLPEQRQQAQRFADNAAQTARALRGKKP